jgi:FKBP-type peptidyl-prolyl cis-trans isomerase 2
MLIYTHNDANKLINNIFLYTLIKNCYFAVHYSFENKNFMTAKANDKVKVHYKGTLSNGEVFDSSEGREPLEFTLGTGQVIPGFDNGVIGMQVEESKTINIPCNEAYGDIREELKQEVPKSQLPPEIKPEVGLQLTSNTPDGQQIPLIITEVKEEAIVVDANHPLAGKDLTFEVTLVAIN